MAKSSQQVEMTFWDHLEDLRWVIIRSLVAISVISVVAFLNKGFIFDKVFLAPKESWFITNQLLCQLSKFLSIDALCLNQSELKIINTSMAGQFTTHMYTSFIIGLFLASPYIIFEFWRFVTPALHSHEKKHTRNAVIVTSVLFVTGVLFGYYLIVPFTIDFLGSYQVSEQVANTITLGSYLQNVVSISLSVGIVFELPVIVYFLTKIGLITPKFMRASRKIVLIILLTIAAIITPPDIISQIMVTIPLVLLYEASILVCNSVYKRSLKKA